MPPTEGKSPTSSSTADVSTPDANAVSSPATIGDLRVCIQSYAIPHRHAGPAGIEVEGMLTNGVDAKTARWASSDAEPPSMRFPIVDLASDLRLTIFDASAQGSPSDNSEAVACIGVGVVSLSQFFQDSRVSELLLNREFHASMRVELLPRQILLRGAIEKPSARIQLQAALEPGAGVPRPRMLLGQIAVDLSLTLSAPPAKLYLQPPPPVIQAPPDWTFMELSAVDRSLGRLKSELQRVNGTLHRPPRCWRFLKDANDNLIMTTMLFLVWTYWSLLAPIWLWGPGAWVVACIWALRINDATVQAAPSDTPFWEDECTVGCPDSPTVNYTLLQVKRVLSRMADAAHVVGWMARAVECTLMSLSFEDPICSWAVLGFLGVGAFFASLALYLWTALLLPGRVLIWATGALMLMPDGPQKEKLASRLKEVVAPLQPHLKKAFSAVTAILLRIPDSSEARHRRLCSRFVSRGEHPDPASVAEAAQEHPSAASSRMPENRSESTASLDSLATESSPKHNFFSEDF